MKRLLAALAIAGAATTAQAETAFNGGHLQFNLGTLIDGGTPSGLGLLDIGGSVDFTIDNVGIQFDAMSTTYISSGTILGSYGSSSLHTYGVWENGTRFGLYMDSGIFITGTEIGVETMFSLGDATVEMSLGKMTVGSDVFGYGFGVYLPVSQGLEFYGQTKGLTDGVDYIGSATLGVLYDLNSPGWSFDANYSRYYESGTGFTDDAVIQLGMRKDLGGTGARTFGRNLFLLLIP